MSWSLFLRHPHHFPGCWPKILSGGGFGWPSGWEGPTAGALESVTTSNRDPLGLTRAVSRPVGNQNLGILSDHFHPTWEGALHPEEGKQELVKEERLVGLTDQTGLVLCRPVMPDALPAWMLTIALATPCLSANMQISSLLVNHFVVNPFVDNPFVINPFVVNPLVVNPWSSIRSLPRCFCQSTCCQSVHCQSVCCKSFVVNLFFSQLFVVNLIVAQDQGMLSVVFSLCQVPANGSFSMSIWPGLIWNLTRTVLFCVLTFTRICATWRFVAFACVLSSAHGTTGPNKAVFDDSAKKFDLQTDTFIRTPFWMFRFSQHFRENPRRKTPLLLLLSSNWIFVAAVLGSATRCVKLSLGGFFFLPNPPSLTSATPNLLEPTPLSHIVLFF